MRTCLLVLCFTTNTSPNAPLPTDLRTWREEKHATRKKQRRAHQVLTTERAHAHTHLIACYLADGYTEGGRRALGRA